MARNPGCRTVLLAQLLFGMPAPQYLLLPLLQLVSLIALLLAWVYIFDTVQRERELLEGPKEGIVGAAGLQDPSQVAHTTTVFPPDRRDSSKSKGGDLENGEMSGQSVSLPPEMILQAAEGRSVGDMYAPMQGVLDTHLAPSCCMTCPARCIRSASHGIVANVLLLLALQSMTVKH